MELNSAVELLWKEVASQSDIKITHFQLGTIIERSYKYAKESIVSNKTNLSDLSLSDLKILINEMKDYIDAFKDDKGVIDEEDPDFISHNLKLETIQVLFEKKQNNILNSI